MDPSNLSRRDFTRLTAAAFGGLVAGSVAGCAKEEPKAPPTPGGAATTTPASGDPAAAVAKVEPHACRGLNTCKTDKNACAGQSACATVKHECATMNDCKYQGGCGENPGANECKGMGGCHVPMTGEHEGAWEKARMAFEERMKAQKKEFGPAPAAAPATGDAEKKS